MSNDFFARWSRRKLEEASPEPVDAVAPVPEAGDTAAPIEAVAEPSGDPITEEELRALPDPDSVTAWPDIAGFLRQGVPLALRNRALRRIWSLDPSIRDYVGDARDYAWDWNVPGGMPVSGPLSASTDVGKIVRGLYEPAPEELQKTAEPLVEHEEMIEPVPDRGTGEAQAAVPEPGVPPATAEPPAKAEQIQTVRLTRHGGALPS